jgi:hypothetical protein
MARRPDDDNRAAVIAGFDAILRWVARHEPVAQL